MNAATLLVRCLENEGVRLVFGLPGEETLELTDAFLDSRIRVIETRHEQGAAFMADRCLFGPRSSGGHHRAGVAESPS
jgi:acetolactate synthase-1/2/3 large subunit